MITFKHLNKCFCGMLILICCLFGEVERINAVETDISGQCISITTSAGTIITPDDVCIAAGYENGCVDAGGVGETLTIYETSNCNPFFWQAITPNANCGDASLSPPNDCVGARVSYLVCDGIRRWGMIPKPSNVPDDFEQSIKNTTDWILGFVGMIAALMLIWGGINYLTSAGDEDKAKTGKKTIAYALIGLVVAGIAYAIVDVIITVIL
ncbi:MAG: pilin [Patescibacteria group bacterium]|nr:pilin [Patescibacteria group bacterium]